MNRFPRLSLCILLPVAACAGPSSTPATPATDASFLQAMHDDGLTEVLAAGYAQSQSTNPAIKAFASRMMSDHSNLDIGLRQLAVAEGVTVPDSPSDTQIARVSAISQMSGAAFDKAYVASEVARHQEMLRAYTAEAASGTDPKVKQYAADRLPAIQSHLQAAEALQGGAGGAGSSAG